ncbi:MAG: hypothetical protein PHP14_01755 [Candidatus Pacebacteria bacterium]|nr:hypothetical protein [Candidatus Paceibacterota bacterium]
MENIFHFIEAISIFLLIFISIGFFVVTKVLRRNKIKQSINYKLMLIKVPRDITQDKNESVKKIAEMISTCDQMISNLNKFKHPIVFEVASPIGSPEIMFYVACHRKHIDMVQKLITAYFPFCEVIETDDYTIFGLNSFNGGAVGKLSTHFALPIKTYQQFESDPFSSILNVFSKNKEDEGMSLQLIISGASSEKKEIKKILEGLKRGEKEKDLFNRKMIDLSGMGASINPFQKDEKDEKEKKEPKMVDETLVKNVESKVVQSLFNVNVRLLVSSSSKDRVDDLIQEVQNGFMQLSSPILNSIELKRIKGKGFKNLVKDYVYRIFDNKTRMTLNSSEINSF